MFRAYAAEAAKGALKPFEFDPGELGADQVEIDIAYCGICHSDLSMLDNEWQFTAYPFVLAHEVAGTVAALGENVKHLRVGQRVGLGWCSGSCMTCAQCMSGDNIAPVTEEFPMSKGNDALEHLQAGNVRYRVVLKKDVQL